MEHWSLKAGYGCYSCPVYGYGRVRLLCVYFGSDYYELLLDSTVPQYITSNGSTRSPIMRHFPVVQCPAKSYAQGRIQVSYSDSSSLTTSTTIEASRPHRRFDCDSALASHFVSKREMRFFREHALTHVCVVYRLSNGTPHGL